MATIPTLHKKDGQLSLHFKTRAIQSRMSLSDPTELVLDYTQTMMGFLLFVPNPRQMAMIGLGGGSLAKYCLAHLPDVNFTAVDISPEVIALRRNFAIPDDGPRFRVLCADGADFVHGQAMPPFDQQLSVLLIDGFDSTGQPPALCSLAFYRDCLNALQPGGVLVVNLCLDDPYYRRSLTRIKEVFKGKSVMVEAEDGANGIVFASLQKHFPPSLTAMNERLRVLNATHHLNLAATVQKIILSADAPHLRRRS